MALLFVDGFDHYATADITKKWNTVVNMTIAAQGRRGGNAGFYTSSTSGATLNKVVAASASFVVGVAYRVSALPTSGAVNLFRFLDAGSLQCSVMLNVDGTLSVTRAGTVLTGGTSVFAISINTYYYIEWKVTIADSIAANSCKVRVNGVDVITVAAGQDTKATANASANGFTLGFSNNPGGFLDATYDDFYLCDQSGSTNNDFLGDVAIDTIYPNADGAYSDFAPSTGTSHFALVDEAAPNDADYVTALPIGSRDSYAFQNPRTLADATIYGVQVNAAALKGDAGGVKGIATFARSGSTNGDGASAALSASSSIYVSQVFETDPATAAAWTQGAVNAAEFGVKITL